MAKCGPDSHHVVPWLQDDWGQDGWDVRRTGAERMCSHHPIKRQAVDRGRGISRKAGTELRIHNLDGCIGQSDSHGNDPHPPIG